MNRSDGSRLLNTISKVYKYNAIEHETHKEGHRFGLSLSYVVITMGARGELKVEAKEGERSVFIIQFATNSHSK